MTAIVSIPASIVRAFYSDSANDLSILATLMTLLLTLTLTWSFMHPQELKSKRFTQLYVLSSARLLPYLFASLIVSIIGLSSMLGVFLIILALSSQLPMLLSLLGVIIVSTGLYLLVRFSLTPYIVSQDGITAISALTLSWQLSKKRWWRLMLAWASILLLVIVLSGAVFTTADIITGYNLTQMWQAVLNTVMVIVLLPVLVGYGAEITKRLQK